MKHTQLFRIFISTVVISLMATAPVWAQGMKGSMKPMEGMGPSMGPM